MTIKILSDDVINRMSAGEVIYESKQALKELIENAIDSGSKQIFVNIFSNNQFMVEIADQGSGILQDDLNLLCSRFATSKIQCYQDISSVTSFGFRGEALASISYVADITVETSNNQGFFVAKYRDGCFLSCQSFPSSQKFGSKFIITFDKLKVVQQQALLIIQQFKSMYPDYSFSLYLDNVIFTDYQNSMTRQLFLEQITSQKQLEHLQYANESFSMDLFFSYGSQKGLQFQSINNRLVKNTILSKIILNINQINSIQKVQHAFLFVSCSQVVDPNCHPQKLIVLISSEQKILGEMNDYIQKELKRKLLQNSKPPSNIISSNDTSPNHFCRIQNSQQSIQSQLSQSQYMGSELCDDIVKQYILLLNISFDESYCLARFQFQRSFIVEYNINNQLIGLKHDQVFIQVLKDLYIISKQKLLLSFLKVQLCRFFLLKLKIYYNPFIYTQNNSFVDEMLGFSRFTYLNPFLTIPKNIIEILPDSCFIFDWNFSSLDQFLDYLSSASSNCNSLSLYQHVISCLSQELIYEHAQVFPLNVVLNFFDRK